VYFFFDLTLTLLFFWGMVCRLMRLLRLWMAATTPGKTLLCYGYDYFLPNLFVRTHHSHTYTTHSHHTTILIQPFTYNHSYTTIHIQPHTHTHLCQPPPPPSTTATAVSSPSSRLESSKALNYLLTGVQTHLESGISRVRLMGMKVAQCFSRYF